MPCKPLALALAAAVTLAVSVCGFAMEPIPDCARPLASSNHGGPSGKELPTAVSLAPNLASIPMATLLALEPNAAQLLFPELATEDGAAEFWISYALSHLHGGPTIRDERDLRSNIWEAGLQRHLSAAAARHGLTIRFENHLPRLKSFSLGLDAAVFDSSGHQVLWISYASYGDFANVAWDQILKDTTQDFAYLAKFEFFSILGLSTGRLGLPQPSWDGALHLIESHPAPLRGLSDVDPELEFLIRSQMEKFGPQHVGRAVTDIYIQAMSLYAANPGTDRLFLMEKTDATALLETARWEKAFLERRIANARTVIAEMEAALRISQPRSYAGVARDPQVGPAPLLITPYNLRRYRLGLEQMEQALAEVTSITNSGRMNYRQFVRLADFHDLATLFRPHLQPFQFERHAAETFPLAILRPNQNELNMEHFNKTRILDVYDLGLVEGTVTFDNSIPTGPNPFLQHDRGHTTQSRTFRMARDLLKSLGGSPRAILTGFFNSWQVRVKHYERFLLICESLSENDRDLATIMWFMVSHEDNYNLHQERPLESPENLWDNLSAAPAGYFRDIRDPRYRRRFEQARERQNNYEEIEDPELLADLKRVAIKLFPSLTSPLAAVSAKFL